MSGTIYGLAQSSCTQKALVVAYELGIELQLSPVNLLKGENLLPAHLARHVCYCEHFTQTSSQITTIPIIINTIITHYNNHRHNDYLIFTIIISRIRIQRSHYTYSSIF